MGIEISKRLGVDAAQTLPRRRAIVWALQGYPENTAEIKSQQNVECAKCQYSENGKCQFGANRTQSRGCRQAIAQTTGVSLEAIRSCATLQCPLKTDSQNNASNVTVTDTQITDYIKSQTAGVNIGEIISYFRLTVNGCGAKVNDSVNNLIQLGVLQKSSDTLPKITVVNKTQKVEA